MNTRLELFMQAEGLSAAKLSEILQVQPSSISHLLSGRNKPNFDFIARILRMFPDLNPDWIINGQGEMYRSKLGRSDILNNDIKNVNYTTTKDDNTIDNKINIPVTNVINEDLFTSPTSPENDSQGRNSDQTYAPIDENDKIDSIGKSTRNIDTGSTLELKPTTIGQSNSASPGLSSEDDTKIDCGTTDRMAIDLRPVSIEKVLVMYSDKTFEVFTEKP